MNRRTLHSTLTAICAGALVLAAACGRTTSDAEAASETSTAAASHDLRGIRTEPVALSTFRRTIETTGTVAFDQDRSTQVLSPISGPVARMLVDVGRRVSAGQSLAIVSSPDFAADVSALRRAEAEAKNARRIADLDAQLFKNDAISRREMEQAEADAVAAESDRDAAVEQLRALGVDSHTLSLIEANQPVPSFGGVIRSPIAGTVVEKLISPGQLLQDSTPCFTVANLAVVWVLANVFESDLSYVDVGDPADVITGSGQRLPGKVTYVGAIVEPSTRAVSVRLEVPNPRDVLKRDLYVRVAIHSKAATQAILVPVSAMLRDDENLPYVFVAKTDGTHERRRVQIGSRIGDRQEIVSGLEPGESIVVEGGLFLESVEQR